MTARGRILRVCHSVPDGVEPVAQLDNSFQPMQPTSAISAILAMQLRVHIFLQHATGMQSGLSSRARAQNKLLCATPAS